MPAKLIENFNPSEWTSYVKEGSRRWKNNKTGEAAVQIDNVITSTFIVPHADDEATDLQGNNPTSTVYIASGYFFPDGKESIDVGQLDPFGFVTAETAQKVADIVIEYADGIQDQVAIAVTPDVVRFSVDRFELLVTYLEKTKRFSIPLISQSFLGGISYANGQVRELTKPTLDGMFADW